jgi:hypothetical protein
MRLPQLKQQSAKPIGSAHTFIQTSAAVVVALATVFGVIPQSKDNPRPGWAGWTLVIFLVLFVLVILGPFVWRMIAFLRNLMVRIARDKAARAEHFELLKFAKRFAQFTNSGDPSNIWHIIHSSYSNDFEKSERVCSTDYMKDLFPLFAQHLETHLAENEAQFLLATQELCGLIASYNKNYVSETFRRMRDKRWEIPPTIDPDLGMPRHTNPGLGSWLSSLPPHYQDGVGRQIEDFRERWARFLDDMKGWLESINESFGASLSTYFERPQKL